MAVMLSILEYIGMEGFLMRERSPGEAELPGSRGLLPLSIASSALPSTITLGSAGEATGLLFSPMEITLFLRKAGIRHLRQTSGLSPGEMERLALQGQFPFQIAS